MNISKIVKSLKHLAVPLLMATVAGVMEFARANGEAEQEKALEDLAGRVALLEGSKQEVEE